MWIHVRPLAQCCNCKCSSQLHKIVKPSSYSLVSSETGEYYQSVWQVVEHYHNQMPHLCKCGHNTCGHTKLLGVCEMWVVPTMPQTKHHTPYVYRPPAWTATQMKQCVLSYYSLVRSPEHAIVVGTPKPSIKQACRSGMYVFIFNDSR